MSGKNRDIEQTSELLRKLLAGKCTAEEISLLRLWAKSDPFLADALQGFEDSASGHDVAHIESIRRHVGSHTTKKRDTAIYWRYAGLAASLLFLVGMGWWIWSTPTNDAPHLAKEQSIEAKEKDGGPEQSATNAGGTIPIKASPSPPLENASQSTKTNQIERAETEMVEPANENIGITKRQAKLKDLVFVDEDSEANEASLDKEIVLDAIQIRNADNSPTNLVDGVPVTPDVHASRTQEEIETEFGVRRLGNVYLPPANEDNSTKNIWGKVSDHNGEALIGVNINWENTSVHTTTDLDGTFEIPANDTSRRLQFSYLGYETHELDVAAETLDVRLNESVVLMESVIVSDYAVGLKKSSVESKQETAVTFKPKGGYKKFNKYVAENTARSSDGRPLNSEIRVKLTFYIQPDGAPINIRVIESFNAHYDAEAIRLLKNGPKWITQPTGQATPAEVEIKFE